MATPNITVNKETIALGVGAAAVLLLATRRDGRSNKKDHLATARWAGNEEKRNARKKGRQQINDRKHNEASVWIGDPLIQWRPDAIPTPGKPTQTDPGDLVAQIARDQSTIYLPNIERGAVVAGSPGSGKTASMMNLIIQSIIDQGFPLVVYSYKHPLETQRCAGLAASQGYQLGCFAPGFEESLVCNPIEFLRDGKDFQMALQVAIMLYRNSGLSDNKSTDRFFSDSAEQLIAAAIMLAKGSKFPDLMTCFSLLSIPGLANRIEKDDLDTWVGVAFSQFKQMKESERTVASVISTALLLLQRLMDPEILNCVCGKSTLPLYLSGKQMLILGMKQERRDVVAPLIASVLSLIVTKNGVPGRKDPLFIVLDEFPTLYLPDIVKWINEFREFGICIILGIQNLAQLEEAYGKHRARSIVAAAATKVIFDPGDKESAEFFSGLLGDEHLEYKTISRNHGKGGGSRTISQQQRTRRLFSSDQFLRLKVGTCVIINPGYETKQESKVPFLTKINIPRASLARSDASKAQWSTVKARLLKKSGLQPVTPEMLKSNQKWVLDHYPLEQKSKTSLHQAATAAGLL